MVITEPASLPDPFGPGPSLEQLGDATVLVYAADGAVLRAGQELVDLVGEAWYLGASWAAVPVSRLPAEFFALRSGVAGEVLQKFVNYRVGLAVVGDVSQHVAASASFRDLVRECNRGTQTWFVADLDELRVRLEGTDANPAGR